jgi:hypothetical protein
MTPLLAGGYLSLLPRSLISRDGFQADDAYVMP